MEPSDPIGDPRLGERLETPQLPIAAPASEGRDIILTSDDFAIRSPAARFDANLEALRILNKVEAESRLATPAEQEIIAKFSGWGDSAFNDAFPKTRGYGSDKAGIWERRGDALKELVGEDEYESIERSRINAFFTTPTVIRGMWAALEQMGANKIAHPVILEPSAGSGRFLGLQPVDMAARSKRIAVELDTTSARMLKQTYPATTVYGMGYQVAPIQNDSVDIAISNVPFGSIPVADKDFAKGSRKLFTTSVHNYFFGKTFDKLRPGGVLAFVTTHGTLDAPTSKPIREALSERGDFLGAVRLPKSAFPDTEVVTDIIFMRKRMPDEAAPGSFGANYSPAASNLSWLETDPVKITITERAPEYRYSGNAPRTTTREVEKNVNRYFIEHPEMVLGKHAATGSMRGADEYTVEADGRDLEATLPEAMTKLPRDVITDRPQVDQTTPRIDVNPMNVTEGAYVIGEDGKLYAKRGSAVVESQASPESQERIRAMLAIRDEARAVLSLQLENASDETIAAAQVKLNADYDAFAVEHGPLNNRENRELIRRDPEGPFLLALETPMARTKEWRRIKKVTPDQLASLKMPLFNQRTVRGKPKGAAATSSDAMLVSLNESGRLDFDKMGELLGRESVDVRQELADERQIFKDPVGDWVTADQYLSGNVRSKLRTAEQAATADPTFQANIEALQIIQPADVPPSQISVKLGTPWVPATDVDDFVKELLGVEQYRYSRRNRYGHLTLYRYVAETGEWLEQTKVDGSPEKMKAEWGTPSMPADNIIIRMLNGKGIEVKDDEGARDDKATAAAQQKAQAIEAEFERWIWADPERSRRLSGVYNDTFNNIRPRRFDGRHQTFPGMVEKWAKGMRPHQKDATWRVVQDGTTLLAHEVGFGKSAVMVASAMELRRLGLARKNMIVVPKATHEQMQNDFREIYPYAKILAPEDDDFTPDRRPEFIARAATGDWDAVILSDSQFQKIPVKPETEAAFLREEMGAIRAAIQLDQSEAMDAARGNEFDAQRTLKQSKSHKELQTALAKAEARLQILQNKINARRTGDKAIYFEDLGIDQLFVDESDAYKNLRYVSRMGRVKGLPATEGSQRAWDMYQKVRYLQQKGNGRGVVFATGTPVANTIAELWTNMRYLQEPMLEERGLQHFDAWAKTFGSTSETLERTVAGTYRPTQRFAQFVNVPELSHMWQAAADIRVVSESPEIVKFRPPLVDEQGKERRTVISVPPNEPQIAWMASLPARVQAMDPNHPEVDNMLKLSTEARLASLDLRMVVPTAPENPNGKIAVAAAKIAQVYRETTPDKGTQLVFLDVGTPKADDGKQAEEPGEGEEEDLDTKEVAVLRDVYSSIKRDLIRAGVPESEIAFAQDPKTAQQKVELLKKVNAGDIRVLIGSTAKMGAGVNVQKRAAALHHLDAPWRPRDIEQREGRILRQGNQVYGPKFDTEGKVTDAGRGVRIYTYVTERSFDEFMWQAIESKAVPIKTIMKREPGVRTVEDADSFVLSASEVKAIASGNPDILKRVALQNTLGKLQLLRASQQDEQVRAREQLKVLPERMAALNKRIAELEQDATNVRPDEPFAMTVGNQTFSERAEAGDALKAAILAWDKSRIPGMKAAEVPAIGRYKGYTLHPFVGGAGWVVLLRRPGLGDDYATTAMAINSETKGSAIVIRVENVVARLPGQLADTKAQLRAAETSVATYEKLAVKPFEQQERLAKVSAELARLDRKIQGEDVEEAAANGAEPDEETVIRADIRQAPSVIEQAEAVIASVGDQPTREELAAADRTITPGTSQAEEYVIYMDGEPAGETVALTPDAMPNFLRNLEEGDPGHSYGLKLLTEAEAAEAARQAKEEAEAAGMSDAEVKNAASYAAREIEEDDPLVSMAEMPDADQDENDQEIQRQEEGVAEIVPINPDPNGIQIEPNDYHAVVTRDADETDERSYGDPFFGDKAEALAAIGDEIRGTGKITRAALVVRESNDIPWAEFWTTVNRAVRVQTMIEDDSRQSEQASEESERVRQIIAAGERGEIPARDEPATTTLNNGVTVFAKMRDGELEAIKYANRTQARVAADRLGGSVYHFPGSSPFYVGPEPKKDVVAEAQTSPPKSAVTHKAALDQLTALRPFIGRSEEMALRQNLRGEEKEFFREKIGEIKQHIDAMPKTYEQEGKGDDAVVHLHYFKNGMDWYITEKDKGAPDDEPGTGQRQAFGLADLYGDGGELGYIDIETIKNAGAELDLYWKPTTLGEVKAGRDRATGRTPSVQAAGIEPKESPMPDEAYEIMRDNEPVGQKVTTTPDRIPNMLRSMQEDDPGHDYGLKPVAETPQPPQTAAAMKIPAEMKAGPGEERVVASVYNEAGELQRRMTVKPDVALKIPVGPGEHVTATAKTADGENVDQQRGQRGSRLRLAITDREIQGLQKGGKLMDSIGDRLAAFKEQQAQFIAERRGGAIERKRKARLD